MFGLERSCRIVSCGGEVIFAFIWLEEIDDAPDGGPEAVDGSLGGFAQMSFHSGECVFDRIEVGTVAKRLADAVQAA